MARGRVVSLVLIMVLGVATQWGTPFPAGEPQEDEWEDGGAGEVEMVGI